VKHFEHTQHHIISIDCNDLSIFCYICDNFVINAKPSEHFKKLRRILQRNQKPGFVSKHRDVKDNKHSLKSIKKVPNKLKLSGLRNLGNTCFMNAVLQSLSNIQIFSSPFTNMPSLENALRSAIPKSITNNDNLLIAEELRKTIILLGEKKKSVISPQSLFSVIWKIVPQFKGYKQQDAQEFLRYMLDRLHTELTTLFPRNSVSKNLSNTSLVTSLFRGVLQNEVKCLVCGTESKKHDPFFDLSLDIPQKYFDDNSSGENCLLSECLNKFTELEELAETELYNCPTCKKKQKSTKKFWIQRLPKVLCLHLKRFKWSECSRSKLDVHIEFPIKDLDMNSFMLANKHETRNNSGSPIYDLSAVIVHHGNGAGTGHYTSFAIHEGYWHHFNDSTVTICNEEAVVNSKAYILFYIQRERDKIDIK